MLHIPYWTESCPYCDRTFGGALGYEGYVRLGFESVICPNRKCGQLLHTKCHEWHHMTGRQKLGYIFSGNVVLLLACATVLGMIHLEDPTSQETWELRMQVARYIATVLVYLAIAKYIRIWRSKLRCPEGTQVLTVAHSKWPVLAMSLFSALGIAGLAAFSYVTPQKEPLAYGALAASVLGIGICGSFRWRMVEGQEPCSVGDKLSPPPIEPGPQTPGF